jgi:glycosyltransferase involved in cell wall biosynthesis
MNDAQLVNHPVPPAQSPVKEALRAPVTTMIFTLNEEPNIGRCLESLRWCDDVIVVDSFSTDRTEAICREQGVRFFQNTFRGFGTQRNWAVENTSPKHDWILILDADERVPPELVRSMSETLASAPPDVAAYRMARRFHLWGRWLRYSSLYPTWVVRLIHRDRVRYVDRGHGETQQVAGTIAELGADLIDENAKGIVDWFERQVRYARKDAAYEVEREALPFRYVEIVSSDPLVRRAALKRLAYRTPGRAGLYFLYSYFLRGGFRDGTDGLAFCTMRALYQQMIAVNKYDLRRNEQARGESRPVSPAARENAGRPSLPTVDRP